MLFSADNKVNKLCAEGMEMEGKGDFAASLQLFTAAWDIAANDAEKCIAAHYLARRQPDAAAKLQWDNTALAHALRVTDTAINGVFPSLYLNIGKCHEDLGNRDLALEHYTKALAHINELEDDGYGNMLRRGIEKGIERVSGTIL